MRDYANSEYDVSRQKLDNNAYEFAVNRLSYYKLNEQGGLVIDDSRSSEDGVFYAADDRRYEFEKQFSTSDTAIIIMDAWADSGTEFLNAQYTPIYRSSILPLVQAFRENGFLQYAFTNEDGNAGYGEALFDELEDMIEEGSLLKRYHANGDVENFQRELQERGIKNLIYLGFASNMCIIGRRVGMFGMYQRGFRTYFVPESSAAVETGDGWDNGLFHEFTTSLIQQNFPGTISKFSIINALTMQ
jgi:hypothetical protein